ncbi:MAG: UvrD-helicase domain-containing protein [Bacillota bacterium]
MLDHESVREYQRLRDQVRQSLLEGLNDQQREAVLHGAGPLLILAGAGSGKTRVIAHRIAHLILFGDHYNPEAMPPRDLAPEDLAVLREEVESGNRLDTGRIAHLLGEGISPWRILAITFTNRAAAEMRERVEALVGPKAKEIWVSTFHSTCVRMLRRDIERLGYAKNFVILDSDDQESVVKDCIKRLGLSDKQFQPGAVLGSISNAKNAMLDAKTYSARAKDYWQQQVAKVYELYQERLKSNNALDFDDLLLLTVQLLERFPDVLEHYQNKFQHILVDEYQDTNHVQNRWVFLLAARRQNLAVVGDDDQGIYSWRGADITNILEFEAQYPGCRAIKLEQNYRSTQNILSAAYEVVRRNLGRKEKRLWTQAGTGDLVRHYTASDENDEAWFVAGEVQRLITEGLSADHRLTYQDFAVLYRTHAQSRALEQAFVSKSIPYEIVGGFKFFERKEIKDVISYLRIMANPSDTLSFRRAIGAPKRGVGPASIDKLVDYAEQWNVPVATAAIDCSLVPGLSGSYQKKVEQFGAMIEELTNMSAYLSVGELIDEVLTRSGYLDELKADPSLEGVARIENLQELRSMATEFEMPTGEEYQGLTSLDIFLSTVALVSDADQGGGGDKVKFMSLHTAKGLEFPVVFLIGMEEGVFPHNRALTDENQMEEERRLCYVGMTRARYRLYLTNALSRTLWGQSNYNAPSRFLQEIPANLVEVAGNARPGRSASAWGTPSSVWGGGGGRRTWGEESEAPRRRSYMEDDDASPAIGASGWGKTVEARRMQETSQSATAGPAPAFEPGDRVVHARFGEGIVRDVRGDTVTVHFPSVGQKVLVSLYLKPAGE